MIDKRKKINMS